MNGSTISKRVDLAGATFQQPVFFVRTTVAGSADFESAAFVDLADFADARFFDSVFLLARFSGDTDFSGARFLGSEVASFTGASFSKPPSFEGALFEGSAAFTHTSSQSGADFERARFLRSVAFGNTTFGGDGKFSGDDFQGLLIFERIKANGDLDFSYADFAKAEFANLSGTGTLLLDHIRVRSDARAILIGPLSVNQLVLAVADVQKHVEATDEASLLRSIEATAKAQNHIATANDADYELHVLASNGYSWPHRALDVVFYRDIAGYLIRPMNPLIALLALLTLMSAVRHMRRPRERGGITITAEERTWSTSGVPSRPIRRPRSHVTTRAAGFLNEYWDTLALTFSRGALTRSEPNLGRRLEVLAYRVLAVCFIIALANTSSILRQLVHAIG